VPLPAGSRFAPATLARTERWTFAVGSFALAWDSITDQPQATGRVAGSYHRGVETPGWGYSADVGAWLLGAAQDRDGTMADTSSYAFGLGASGTTEVRFYVAGGDGLFFHGAGSAGVATSAVQVEVPGGADVQDHTPSLDLGIGLGVGYGRTVDVGVRMRVRRIEAVLRRARLLGRSINVDVAARLMTAWWNERSELGYRKTLAATVQILREAGVLLQDPDPSTTYQILAVLTDGQLERRPSGFDARVGVGELFLGRDDVDAEDSFDVSRQEVLLARTTFARQLGDDTEIVATGRGLYRLTGDAQAGQPKYVFADADVVFRRYFYGEAWDPRGALELGASAGSADADTDDDTAGQSSHLSARAGWVWFPGRQSRVAAGANIRLEGSERFALITISGSWSLASAAFAAW
jgi:hypothetical protein